MLLSHQETRILFHEPAPIYQLQQEVSLTGNQHVLWCCLLYTSVGSYATDIKGNVDIVINSGSFSSQIMGGIYANANNGIITLSDN